MHRQRNSGRTRVEATAREVSGVIAAAPSALPAWNRERLIEQFQDIDGFDAQRRRASDRRLRAQFLGWFRGFVRHC
jgi:quinol monooxygenase YgiN